MQQRLGLKNKANAEVPKTAVLEWPLEVGSKKESILIRPCVKMANYSRTKKVNFPFQLYRGEFGISNLKLN